MPSLAAQPDPIAQTLRVRLDAQEARRVWKYRSRIWFREALTTQHFEQYLGGASGNVGIGHPVGRGVTEVAPSIDWAV